MLQVHPTPLPRPRQTPGSRPSDPERDPASESSRAALRQLLPVHTRKPTCQPWLTNTSMKREENTDMRGRAHGARAQVLTPGLAETSQSGLPRTNGPGSGRSKARVCRPHVRAAASRPHSAVGYQQAESLLLKGAAAGKSRLGQAFPPRSADDGRN